MSFKEFKGWEHIDGSAVSGKEIEASFSTVMKQARAIEEEYISRRMKERAARFRKAAVAAAAAVLLIAAPFAAYYFYETDSAPLTAECFAPKGEITEITLEDGSKVTLNAGSRLSYPEKFGRKRVVELSGEAVFDVTANKTRPFIVKTESICVTAHGTVFNVCDYPSDPSACATLCSGKISVSRADGKGWEIPLDQEQALTYEKATGATFVADVQADEAVSWMDGDLRIRSMKLEQVLKVVERKYDVIIHLTTDRHSSAVLTAKFINDESLAEIMDALCKLVPGMEYVIEDDNIYIR